MTTITSTDVSAANRATTDFPLSTSVGTAVSAASRATTGFPLATSVGTSAALDASRGYTGVVQAPVIGIRKDNFKLVGDMSVRPKDYRGRA